MNKADEISGIVTILVGAVALITVWPVAETIGSLQPIVAQSLVQSLIGLALLKYGFETAGL